MAPAFIPSGQEGQEVQEAQGLFLQCFIVYETKR